MGWLAALAGYAAPMFLIMSPILSYGDQALAMSRKRSSAGFSLDIPLIMLVASLLRYVVFLLSVATALCTGADSFACSIFYYPGARFDKALLIQSCIMVVVQLGLLKIALDNRPSPTAKGGEAAVPFAGLEARGGGGGGGGLFARRPYNFWQWRSPKPWVTLPLTPGAGLNASLTRSRYWHFLLYLFVTLLAAEVLLGPFAGLYAAYSTLIGYIGLSVEATLPLPQIRANARARSCRGFRLSVLASWLAGDAMKMFWFFTSTTEIPWAFKLCGLFQAACDAFLGIQYLMYGDGSSSSMSTGEMDGGVAGSGPGIMLKEKESAFRSAAASILPMGHGEYR